MTYFRDQEVDWKTRNIRGLVSAINIYNDEAIVNLAKTSRTRKKLVNSIILSKEDFDTNPPFYAVLNLTKYYII